MWSCLMTTSHLYSTALSLAHFFVVMRTIDPLSDVQFKPHYRYRLPSHNSTSNTTLAGVATGVGRLVK